MLGNAREYKTRERHAMANLSIHKQYTDKFIEEGMSESEASKKAYDMIIDGSLNVEITSEYKRLTSEQNKRRKEHE